MPEPSRLVKLEHLHNIGVGNKVRFLGCVHAYDGKTAYLTIKDQYPASGKHVPTSIVNVTALLDSMRHDLLETGAWLNIVGYIRPLPDVLIGSMQANARSAKLKTGVAFVEATMIWSAGAIKVDSYNSALTELQKSAAKVEDTPCLDVGAARGGG